MRKDQSLQKGSLKIKVMPRKATGATPQAPRRALIRKTWPQAHTRVQLPSRLSVCHFFLS